MDTGGDHKPPLGRRRRDLKLQELSEARTEPPRPSAFCIASRARTFHPLAAMAGRENRNCTRRLRTRMATLEDRGAGHAPHHRPLPLLATTAGRGRSQRRQAKPPLSAAPTHCSRSTPATTRTGSHRPLHPLLLTTTVSHRKTKKGGDSIAMEATSGP
jgi:hypothetical protein